MSADIQNLQNFVWIALVLGIAFVAGLVLHFILFVIFRLFARRSPGIVRQSLIKHCSAPLRLTIITIAFFIGATFLPLFEISSVWLNFLRHLLTLLLIAGVAWLLIRLTGVFNDFILHRFSVEVKDNLRARKVQTQLQLLKRIAIIVVSILAFAAMLMTFDRVRQLGTSILASAGVIGIVVGFAAQHSLATMIAGIQIAVTQPIRLDDVVVVEGEWGRIEEITLTYVVVRIWDLRRLVLPINYFIEKPFQNWTRVSADLLGTVFLYADYSVPTDAVRGELYRILQESPDWDKKVWGLQVTNTTDKTVELRALMSAADSSSAWNLRCHVREKLIDFLRRNYPDAMPRFRAELQQIKPEK